MSEQHGIRVVENLGHGHAVELELKPTRDSINLVPRPGGNEMTFATDVLHSLNKKAWISASKLQRNEPARNAILWVRSAEIRNVYVSNADWMDQSQYDFADRLAEHCTVWLLYAESSKNAPPGLNAMCLEGRDALPKNVNRLMREGGGTPEFSWEDFPSIPEVGHLLFRGRCAKLLDEHQLSQVDAAMAVGASLMLTAIAESPEKMESTAEEIVRAEALTNWPAISMIRGAQLAANRVGWRLGFDVGRWQVIRRCGASIEEHDLRMLVASVDPWLPTLYLVSRLAPVTARDIAQLNSSDLQANGQAFRWWDRNYSIPIQASQIVRAFHEHFVQGRPENEPLFETKSNRRMSSTQVRTRLESVCRALAIPRPPACTHDASWKISSVIWTLRPLDCQGIGA